MEVVEMKCALASMGFINKDISYNKQVIMDTMVKYSKERRLINGGTRVKIMLT